MPLSPVIFLCKHGIGRKARNSTWGFFACVDALWPLRWLPEAISVPFESKLGRQGASPGFKQNRRPPDAPAKITPHKAGAALLVRLMPDGHHRGAAAACEQVNREAIMEEALMALLWLRQPVQASFQTAPACLLALHLAKIDQRDR